jgi:hypothetical protein
MKLKFKFLLITIFFFQLTYSFSQGEEKLDKAVIEDLSDNWLVYDENYNAYFPLLNKTINLTSVSQLVDLDRYRSYNLNFKSSPGLSVFLENKLIHANYSKEIEWVSLQINELLNNTTHEKEFLTLFNNEGQFPLDIFYIGFNSAITLNKTSLTVSEEIKIREVESQQELYLILFLLILFAIVILKTRYPGKFREFFGFSKVIPEKDETLIWDPSGAPFILFVLINTLCGSLILLVINNEFDLNSLHFLNAFNTGTFVGILILTGVFCMIYLLKYLHLEFFGWVFNVQTLVKYQFLELMKVSTKVNIFLTIIILIFHGSGYGFLEINFDYFFYFCLLTISIVLLRVGYLTFTMSGFRNIYLFSYLCTTEILPLVIIGKLILF